MDHAWLSVSSEHQSLARVMKTTILDASNQALAQQDHSEHEYLHNRMQKLEAEIEEPTTVTRHLPDRTPPSTTLLLNWEHSNLLNRMEKLEADIAGAESRNETVQTDSRASG
ncbi:unnamed protein product [Zymoseptoria tritici ST99CH_1A5]|uniref:Uncharacterized protein n=1 Tax=Zymoseptoria tritici ST99CH_1A5 TaxID=1276529 RepID=A0A1Y6M373_ZYMTR|nr:unnamed protein product [Zymoseptoria tritici ST99CH_1A5]